MLDHKAYKDKSIFDVASDLDKLCVNLDQKHRQERKIQFLLDIRGYFIVNELKGNYVEFGLFRGEMMYSAWRILETTGCLKNYIGLDTFTGVPEPSNSEAKKNTYTVKGIFESEYQQTEKFLIQFIEKSRLRLIAGDLRDDGIIGQAKEPENKIALAVVDCNLVSSLAKAVEFAVANLVRGGVLFIDDYFFNMKEGGFPIGDPMEKAAKENNCQILEYKTYPPCARAFIVVNS